MMVKKASPLVRQCYRLKFKDIAEIKSHSKELYLFVIFKIVFYEAHFCLGLWFCELFYGIINLFTTSLKIITLKNLIQFY